MFEACVYLFRNEYLFALVVLIVRCEIIKLRKQKMYNQNVSSTTSSTSAAAGSSSSSPTNSNSFRVRERERSDIISEKDKNPVNP